MRHAVAVPAPALKLGSVGSQAMSPAAAMTGSTAWTAAGERVSRTAKSAWRRFIEGRLYASCSRAPEELSALAPLPSLRAPLVLYQCRSQDSAVERSRCNSAPGGGRGFLRVTRGAGS